MDLANLSGRNFKGPFGEAGEDPAFCLSLSFNRQKGAGKKAAVFVRLWTERSFLPFAASKGGFERREGLPGFPTLFCMMAGWAESGPHSGAPMRPIERRHWAGGAALLPAGLILLLWVPIERVRNRHFPFWLYRGPVFRPLCRGKCLEIFRRLLWKIPSSMSAASKASFRKKALTPAASSPLFWAFWKTLQKGSCAAARPASAAQALASALTLIIFCCCYDHT